MLVYHPFNMPSLPFSNYPYTISLLDKKNDVNLKKISTIILNICVFLSWKKTIKSSFYIIFLSKIVLKSNFTLPSIPNACPQMDIQVSFLNFVTFKKKFWQFLKKKKKNLEFFLKVKYFRVHKRTLVCNSHLRPLSYKKHIFWSKHWVYMTSRHL